MFEPISKHNSKNRIGNLFALDPVNKNEYLQSPKEILYKAANNP